MNARETFIFFELGGACYAVRSRDVLHIELLEHVSPVPRAAAAVAGVVFSRGQVVPALDLRRRFGLPPQEPTPRTRLIFLRIADRTVAIIVDSAREFRAVPAEAIRPVDETLHGVPGNAIEAVFTDGGRTVLLLDLPAVLAVDAAAAAEALA